MKKLIVILAVLFMCSGAIADSLPFKKPSPIDCNGSDCTIDRDTTVSGDTSLDGSLTVNESGADKDTRMESDNRTHMFYIDASDDTVGIGTDLSTESAVDADSFITFWNGPPVAGTTSEPKTLQIVWRTDGESLPATFTPLNISSLMNVDSFNPSGFNMVYGGFHNKVTFDGKDIDGDSIIRAGENWIQVKASGSTADGNSTFADGTVSKSVFQNSSATYEFTFDNIYMYNEDILDNGAANLNITNFIHHNIVSSPDFGGTLTNQYGILIADQTNFTNNYGIVLIDGADGIYFEGITGPSLKGDANQITASKAVGLGFYTGDPCGTIAEGTIWYNDTSDYMCFCDGGGVDKKVSDNGACF